MGRRVKNAVFENCKPEEENKISVLLDVRQMLDTIEDQLAYLIEDDPEEEAWEADAEEAESGDDDVTTEIGDRLTKLEAIVIAQDKRLARLVEEFRRHTQHPPYKVGE
jgi:hypothetical protein